MGLFDAFGVGGGSLSIQLQSPQAEAGGMVYGAVLFTAGRRAQQITNVTVKLSCSRQTPQPNGQLMQQSRDIVPAYALVGAFATQPGQSYQFPFQLQLPPDAVGSSPNLVTWRISANADIDGEVDPGAGVELHVIGHAYQPHGMMPMGIPGYQNPPMPYGKPGYHDPNDPYGKGVHDPKAPYGKGEYHDPKAPYGKPGVHDPNDPYGKGVHDPNDPYGKGQYHDPKAPYGKGGGKY